MTVFLTHRRLEGADLLLQPAYQDVPLHARVQVCLFDDFEFAFDRSP